MKHPRSSCIRVTHRRPAAGAVLAGIAPLLLVAGCGSSSDPAAGSVSTPTAPAPYTVDTTDLPASTAGQTVALRATDGHPTWRQIGTAAVRVRLQTLEGGGVRAVRGWDGDRAIQFPPYVSTGAYPRAVVVVTNAGSSDALNPKSLAFSWGADFRLDRRTEGRSIDNGNNLVERGLFSESSFYKAELDHDKPACSVRGTGGLVIVRALRTVTPGAWYRIRCRRRGNELSVTAVELDRHAAAISAVEVGATGSVVMADPGTPLAVGGKLAQNGRIIKSATDQFNGAVANPFLDIGDVG